jgi:hypothetical protein
MAKAKTTLDEIREAAEADPEAFIRLVHPKRVLGSIHSEIIDWIEREGHSSHQLVLMPRDHMKSAIAAYWVAWQIVKNPAVRVLYLSSTANLAVKQLKFIKDILTSDVVARYWPNLVNREEANREKWTETEISVDHPKRKEENVRDPTVFTGGLTTTLTGLHCDIQVLDDVVVKENAYTEDGRQKVKEQYSLLSSIASGECRQLVVGTKYFPTDLYHDLVEMEVDIFDDTGELVGTYKLYELFRDGDCVVENSIGRTGNGEFLWPRQQRKDGQWFGFNADILAKKRAQYLDKIQYYAQYYNDPNDPAGAGISSDLFQYYDRGHLSRANGYWYYKGTRLNVFASVDFAFSLNEAADYTAIVVVGVDTHFNYYILDIDRFRTKLISDYFKSILRLHQKWDFRKIRAEVTVAQVVIVNDLRTNYIRPHGLALAIDEYRPSRAEGNKAERVSSILQPRYANRQIWHYQGGHCQTLEEELILSNPAHDDIKDCLASCIDVCIAPSGHQAKPMWVNGNIGTNVIHPRFGGVS